MDDPIPTPTPEAHTTPGQDPTSEREDVPTEAGFFTRLGWLLFSPGVLGDQLRDRPRWFLPALFGLVLTLTGILLIPADVFLDGIRAQALEAGRESPFGDSAAGWFKLASAGGLLVFWWVILAIGAGIYSLVFAFVLGDEGRFRQYLAASAWGSVIAGFGGLVLTPLRIAARNPQLTLSPGTFLQTVLEDGYLLRVASGLDFFALWSWVVTGILISRIDPRRSATSAVCIVGGIFLVFILTISAFTGG